MRTAPVVVLTQAEMFVDTGAATAAAATISKQERISKRLRENMDTSRQVVCSSYGKAAYRILTRNQANPCPIPPQNTYPARVLQYSLSDRMRIFQIGRASCRERV